MTEGVTEPWRFDAADDPAPVLALIRAAFGDTDGRIDPPSSMHRLSAADALHQAVAGEVWVIGPADAPRACAFFTQDPNALYIGKLAVADRARGRGHARALVDRAEARARALGLPALELRTPVDLAENHTAFARPDFARTGADAHPGFDQPTSYTYRRSVSPPGRG